MNLIVGFCIIFIGVLIFWEFSKKILIKTVEALALNNGFPEPIKLLDLSKIDGIEKEISVVQSKLNEVIRSFNNLQEILADVDEHHNIVNIKDLDLSTIVSTNNELKAIQSKLNEIIGAFNKYRTEAEELSHAADITNLDLSKIGSTAKKLNAVQVKLNELINAYNISMEDMNKENKAKVEDGQAESDVSEAETENKNKQNEQMNDWLENR